MIFLNIGEVVCIFVVVVLGIFDILVFVSLFNLEVNFVFLIDFSLIVLIL